MVRGAESADDRAMRQIIDWSKIQAELDAAGCAVIPALLDPTECAALAGRYDDPKIFRSRVVMGHHGFGSGEYKYFADPLPEPVAGMRAGLYPRLAPIANRWAEQLGQAVRYPADHAAFLRRCHAAGQDRPTPLLLKYGPGDYNCLHQDLYGDLAFPLQVAILLSDESRLRRRRVRAGRAAAAHAVPARSGAAAPGRRRGLRR